MTFSRTLLAVILVVATFLSFAQCEDDAAKTGKQIVLKDLLLLASLSNRQNTYDSSLPSSAANEENWPESEINSNNNNNNYEEGNEQQNTQQYGVTGGNDDNYREANKQQNAQQYGSSSSNNNNVYNHHQQQSVASKNQYASAQASVARQEVLLNVNFFEDAGQVDPRKLGSQWEWIGTGTNTTFLADQAAFVKRPAGAYKSGGYLDLISVPFSRYVNNTDPAAALTVFQAAIAPRNTTYTLNRSQKLLVRLLFGCETINADQFPFPATLVTNPWNDPRLANCIFRLSGNDTGLAILVTNKGVWATNYRLNFSGSIPPGAQTFVSYRLIGTRKSVKDLVDGAIEYDARLNQASFFVNGLRVWTIMSVGAPPPNEGGTRTVATTDGRTAQTVTFNSLQVSLGTSQFLDDFDPNNPQSGGGIVVLTQRENYPATFPFYDPIGYRGNITWGQGAIASLYKLKVVLGDSLMQATGPAAPATSAGVYGQEG